MGLANEVNRQMGKQLEAGLEFSWTYTVPQRALVPELFGDIEPCDQMPAVLSTPFLAGVMECACVRAVVPYLDWPEQQCVGTLISVTHLAATPPGAVLLIQGRLSSVVGKLLRFEISARDGVDTISEGVHERTIIDTARFNRKLANKAALLNLTLLDNRLKTA